ncbi:HAMP domain-containing sensor histidine kinase [Clostridium malenominatum]|uniref:histidine kinase n=1 Tax=Clostridium malenominatum TaxID=1539 RepID=A0ABP3TYG6_9CLOT
MKIKKWLTLSYITVMLIPIVTSLMLFFWMQHYNKQREMDDYVSSIKKFEKYDKLLSDKELFNNYPFKKIDLIEEEDRNSTKIEIYDKNGVRLYASINDNASYIYPISREQLYSKLYEINHGFRVDTLKKPVFHEGDLIGFYQITIVRSKLIQGINKGTIIAMSIFITVFIVVLMIIIKLMDRKFNKPLLLLIDSIKDFAKGEETSINYKSKDEIGELINHFNNMKMAIKEKDYEIEKEQKSKEYMTAAISHDLKTPLTSIRAYAELISSQREEDNERYVLGILNKCDYMSNMLEDLLMYTILSSSYTMNFVDVDGEEFFQMLLSGYEEICEKSNINYKTEIKVKGNYGVDVKQLIRVIDNLMSNAITHTEEGQSIYMGAFSEEFSLPHWISGEEENRLKELRKNNVVLLVKNQGEEIPKEDMERIMEPFYKVDNSRNKKIGTGLGLSIVKLIMDKHNGKIVISSSKERGTLIACFIKKGK